MTRSLGRRRLSAGASASPRRGQHVVDSPTARPGTHICWAYDEPEEFRTAAEAFLAEGIARGERAVYLADRPADELPEDLDGLDTDSLLACGMLVTRPIRDVYPPGPDFDGLAQVETYRAMTEAAISDGLSGLRVAADATALAEQHGNRFAAYELLADRLLAQANMAALCAYSKHTAVLPDLLSVHPSFHGAADALVAGAWFEGETLHLAGELDAATGAVTDAVVAAVAESPEIEHVDLSELEFIDVRNLARLEALSGELLNSGRQVRVSAAPEFVRRCCDTLNFRHLVNALDSA